MIPQAEHNTQARLALLMRVGIFVILAVGTWIVAPVVLGLATIQLVVISALSSFAAGAIPNAISVRAFESGRFSDFGLGWKGSSLREFGLGVGTAAAGAAIVVLGPVVTGAARFEAAPRSENALASAVLLTLVLLFGAAGEEMMFHGYAFQLLVRQVGAFATILPVSVIFGLAHSPNLNVNVLGIVNTAAWGVLLGWAYVRVESLWLPIGLHFGWNLALPLLGANLSGFTMGLTGYELRWSAGQIWSGGAYGPEGGLLTTGVVVALFFTLHRLIPAADAGTGGE
jgi:membrane protease YdiL (CAAX protease family)